MTGRWTTLIVVLVLGFFGVQMLVGADPALEKTAEKAKEKRLAEIEKASAAFHKSVEKANASLTKAFESAIANAKRKKEDSKVESLTKLQETLTSQVEFDKGSAPSVDDTQLSGAIKKRNADLVAAEAAFKSAVDRANSTLETTYNAVIAGYKRKSDARADELTTELASIKAETPAKGEAPEPKGGNGHQELIKSVGDSLFDAKDKKVSSKVLGNQEYVLVYFSASWCGPCRAFTPELVKFHEEYSKKAKFEILLVGADQSAKEMLDYMSTDKMPWLGVPYGSAGANGLQTKHGVRGIPALVAYDKEGNVISTGTSARAVLAEFKQKIGVK